MTSTASLSRKCNPQEELEDQLGTQGTGEGGRSGIRGLFGKRTALGEVSFLGQILLVYPVTQFSTKVLNRMIGGQSFLLQLQ